MTVNVSVWNDQEEHKLRVFIFRNDNPDFQTIGDGGTLEQHELLEFLSTLGQSDAEARTFLELILERPVVRRMQFRLTDEQVARIKESFFHEW